MALEKRALRRKPPATATPSAYGTPRPSSTLPSPTGLRFRRKAGTSRPVAHQSPGGGRVSIQYLCVPIPYLKLSIS